MPQLDSPDPDRARNLTEARELRLYLKTVGDLVRLQVLRELAQGSEMSVTELARALRVSQPLLSWHLGVLRRIDLVSMRPDGRVVWYAINRQTLRSYNQRFDTWIDGNDDAGSTGEESEHA